MWTRYVCLTGGMLLMPVVLCASEFYAMGTNDTLTFRTKRMEVDVCDARIVGVRSLGGAVLASSQTPSASVTAGLGNMTGQAKELSAMHSPWGERQTPQLPPGIYRFPSEQTRRDVTEKDGVVTASWIGLSDGKAFFPNDSIVITFREDKNGALEMTAVGKSPERGVFGIQVPIENLDGQGKFLLPTFGGIEYAASGKPSLMTFQNTTLFYEAKLMTYTLGDTSLGYWFEDATFRPYYAFFGRGQDASSFAIEINTLMPFEANHEVVTPVFKMDVFDDADWVAAARPYRDWYQTTFAADIARRESIAWANGINAIVDSGAPSAGTLDRVAQFMDPKKVLFHVWEARQGGFSDGIPDFVPRDDYVEGVKLAHERGFKVMCYVNAICAHYMRPVWERDNVGDFFLTRKNNINNYHGNKNVFDENLAGSLTAAKDGDQFANIKPGELLYGDPLSSGWRRYYLDVIINFSKASGTDAHYQDCLGVTGDTGNGVIDGFSGAQGNMLITRDLQKALPETPMASEFGSEAIAFGVKWPLNYAQVWGGLAFHKQRIHDQRPLTTFIFGYRPWTATANAPDDFHKHVISAVADSLGAVAMFSANSAMTMKSGYDDHLVLRAKTFVDNSLVPYFPERKYPENIVCMYKDAKGGIYNYFDDGKFQALLDPAGKALYGRVHGVSTVKTADHHLNLPGWPCYDDVAVYGLNPERYYALFPQTGNSPEFNFGCPPDNAQLSRYYIAEDFAYTEFTGTGQAEIRVKAPARFTTMLANDEPVTGNVVSGELPLRLVFFTGKTVAPDKVRKIESGSGLEQGQAEPLPTLRRTFAGKTLYHINYFSVKTLDSVHCVENDDEAIEFLFVNTQEQYGDGSIVTALVNGNPVASFDCYTDKKFDTQLRKWSVPVGRFKGREILFTVQVDDKGSANSDMQWISLPEKVRGAKQEFVETLPDPKN